MFSDLIDTTSLSQTAPAETGGLPAPMYGGAISIGNNETVTLYDTDVTPDSIPDLMKVSGVNEADTWSDMYQLQWTDTTHWTASYMEFIEFGTAYDSFDRPTEVMLDGTAQTITWLIDPLASTPADNVVATVANFIETDEGVSYSIGVDILDFNGGLPDQLIFTETNTTTNEVFSGTMELIDWEFDTTNPNQPVAVTGVAIASDWDEDFLSGTAVIASGATVPTITIDSSAVTLELSDTTRNIDEDLHNSGRRIAFNGDGANVAPNTVDTTKHHATLSVNDASLTSFDDWSLKVSGAPADTLTHQLRLLVSEKSGVFDVDYDNVSVIKPITYYADATYSGQDGSAVVAGSNGVVIGTVDMYGLSDSNGKNGDPLVIELNSNATAGVVEELVSHITLTVRNASGQQTEDWGAIDAIDPSITFELFDGVNTQAVTADTRTVDLISQPEDGGGETPPPSGDVSVHVTSWKGMTDLQGVTLAAGHMTGMGGTASFTKDAATTTMSFSPVWEMDSTEQATADDAVDLQDAITILKMIVGLPIDNSGSDISPYQSIAGDFDANGTVGLNDAIGVLKHVVGLPTQGQADWVFVDPDMMTSSGTPLQPGMVGSDISKDVSMESAIELVGVLRGDVDGSWEM